MRRPSRIVLCAWAVSVLAIGTALSLPLSFTVTQGAAYEQVRARAADQHEVVMLLIKKGAFGRVIAETRKLLAIRFPADHESQMVSSIVAIAVALADQSRPELAQQVLDDGLRSATLAKSKTELYRRKALLFKREGKEDEAIRFFKMAMDVDGNP